MISPELLVMAPLPILAADVVGTIMVVEVGVLAAGAAAATVGAGALAEPVLTGEGLLAAGAVPPPVLLGADTLVVLVLVETLLVGLLGATATTGVLPVDVFEGVAVLLTGVTDIVPDVPPEELPGMPGISGNGTFTPGMERVEPLGIAMLMLRSTKMPWA